MDEHDGKVVDWSDLTEEDRLVVAELVAQQQPREEPEAAAEPPDDDESRASAAVLDALFNESDFEGFAPAEVEASTMPTFGARVNSSEEDMGENHEGEGEPARMSTIRILTMNLLMAWTRTIFRTHTCRLRGCRYSMNIMDLSSMTQNPPPSRFSPIFFLMRSWIC